VRYLGRWLSLATIAAAVMVVVGAIATGAFAQGRLHGVFGLNWVLNPNALAGVFAICFAVMVGHGTSQRISEQERAAVLIGSLLPLAVVLLTQSRGAMLGCAAGALVACLALRRRVTQVVFGLVLAAAVVIVLAFPGWVQLLLMRGDSSRLAIWVHFLELARAKPWLGYGLDYDVTYKLGAGTIHTPHNILIAALVRGGVLGLLPLVVTLATAILAAVTAARRQWWLPLIVLTTALALSSVDHELLPTQFGFYWYLFWLPLGLAAAAALAPCDLAASETSAGSVEGQAVPSDRMRSTVAPSPVR
jgi:O-antigen ligase